MPVFHLLGYKYIFDPAFALEFISHMWATEPVGTASICVTLTGILLTLSLKMFDLWWEAQKDRARRGRLKIELTALLNPDGKPACVAIISNVGKEPVVIRELGYVESHWLGHQFIPFAITSYAGMPYTLNAHGLLKKEIQDPEFTINHLDHFRVLDSLGRQWAAPNREASKAKRQLKQLLQQYGGKINFKPGAVSSNTTVQAQETSAV